MKVVWKSYTNPGTIDEDLKLSDNHRHYIPSLPNIPNSVDRINIDPRNSVLLAAYVVSDLIAISGHYDCAGNPCEEEIQKEQVKQSIEYLKNLYPNAEIIGLWIDENWKVCLIGT